MRDAVRTRARPPRPSSTPQSTVSLLRVALEVALQAQLSSRAIARHITDGPEDGALGAPGAIVAAEDPGDAGVRIRITAVDRVAIVQPDQPLQRGFRRRAPLEHLLAPEHA